MKVPGLFLYALLRNGIPKTREKYQNEGTAHPPRAFMGEIPDRGRLFLQRDVPGLFLQRDVPETEEHLREAYSPS